MTFPQFDIPWFVNADRTRMKQVLINLLSNAIKYNRGWGTVVVDCTASAPERIRISVKDTGEGLPPEKLAQLFQPFNRLGQAGSAEQGTGIGLVVSKRLVELMHGVIGVESAVGVGSVFWIELVSDVAPQPAAGGAEPSAVAPPQLPNSARLRTLLYVEDNPANLQLVEQLIARRSDMRLLSAGDGNLGIEIARTSQPDVILMDIGLPGISGVEALRILRQDPATARIPVVAISANAIPRDIEKGLEAGFFRYLTKPIKVDEFMDALNVALASAEKTNESVRVLPGDQYVYTGRAGAEAGATGALTSEVLAALPAELICRMREAAMNADLDQLLTLTDEVERCDSHSAQRLRQFLDAFDYQGLLDVLQSGART
jgi:CheY-like chemotaxis protein